MHLVLNSYGCALSRHKGRFCVRKGEEVQYFSPYQVSHITLTNACTLTTDAILLALEHEIPILMQSRNGQPLGRFWAHSYGRMVALRRAQLEFVQSVAATQWICQLLTLKSQFQSQLLSQLARKRPKFRHVLKEGIQQITHQALGFRRYHTRHLRTVGDKIRGVEGAISALYFRHINLCMPRKYQFTMRTRRPALDRFNACLNYTYGMLYHMVESALVAAQLDPYLPALHGISRGNPAFAYDFIEPWRPWADQVVVDLCLQKELKEHHFRDKDEGLWLSDTGRALLVARFDHHMGKRFEWDGQRPIRRNYMVEQAQSLARQL